jgi:hypothetical protein
MGLRIYITRIAGDLSGSADALGAAVVAIDGLHGTKLAAAARGGETPGQR